MLHSKSQRIYFFPNFDHHTANTFDLSAHTNVHQYEQTISQELSSEITYNPITNDVRYMPILFKIIQFLKGTFSLKITGSITVT